jgi:hypothetical protein
MPDPTRLLRTLLKAVDLFRVTPGRHGMVLELAGCEELVVAGDLHGNVENFRKLLRCANLAAHPRRHLVLQELIHGPARYPGGGDRSHQLLDLTAALKCEFPGRVHFLLGNHELSQWSKRAIVKNDLDLNRLFRQGVEEAYGDAGAEIYAAYEMLFAAAALLVRTPNRIAVCHSVPSALGLERFHLGALRREPIEPAELARGGSAHALVWGRDASPETVSAFLAQVDADYAITGHIPCPERGFAIPNERQVILDAQGSPACACLVAADRPVTQEEIVHGIAVL